MIYSGDQIKEDEMDRAFGMYGVVQNKHILIDTKELLLGRPRHRWDGFL